MHAIDNNMDADNTKCWASQCVNKWKLVTTYYVSVVMRRCVAQRRDMVVSSPDGIQVKLNASMYLKPHSLGLKFAKILR